MKKDTFDLPSFLAGVAVGFFMSVPKGSAAPSRLAIPKSKGKPPRPAVKKRGRRGALGRKLRRKRSLT